MSKFIMPFVNYEECEHKGLDKAGEDIVDTLGFMKREQKIRNFMNAGIDLYKFRAENYDAHMSTPDGDLTKNPFRDRGMDFSDFHRNKKRLEEMQKRMAETVQREQKREAERVAKMEADKSAKTASETLPEGPTTAVS